MATPKLPRRLYKYRPFDVHSLRLLAQHEVFYANPQEFNDPLDCRPEIEVDTDRTSLERLCYQMLLVRGRSKDPAVNKEAAAKVIGRHRYMSTEYGDYRADPEAEKSYMESLKFEIAELLANEMASRGVLSLTQRWNCPLMWSHYADEHREYLH